MSDKVVNSDFEEKLLMFLFTLWFCIYQRSYRKEARPRVFGVKRAFCDVKTGASALKMQQNAALSSKMDYGKNQTLALCARTRIWPEARLPSRKTFFDKNSLCCCIFNAEAHCFDLAERSLDTENPKMNFFSYRFFDKYRTTKQNETWKAFSRNRSWQLRATSWVTRSHHFIF